MAGNHSQKGDMPPHLWYVHGGGADSRDEPVGAMVVPGRGKWTLGVDKYVV